MLKKLINADKLANVRKQSTCMEESQNEQEKKEREKGEEKRDRHRDRDEKRERKDTHIAGRLIAFGRLYGEEIS